MKMWYKELFWYLGLIRKADITTGTERHNLQNPEGSETMLRRSTSRLWVSKTDFEILSLSERLKVLQNWERKQKIVFVRKILVVSCRYDLE